MIINPTWSSQLLLEYVGTVYKTTPIHSPDWHHHHHLSPVAVEQRLQGITVGPTRLVSHNFLQLLPEHLPEHVINTHQVSLSSQNEDPGQFFFVCS